ncbi:tRNA pseudouridine32 synthase / 23S rRNA pseudouridine746 synthase [Antricoccus suffuscus]|uniref:RNA pseudouridylate synthase n=2 Tax=Antricoccus suffuscus TaxID=1629062 RepID=A0A2T0ZQR1_9ACTN|nr:tRNA pseudouridine32 synthase / 23S rRNA pseudouridine746 synthase [Antricoccus suffuscus]
MLAGGEIVTREGPLGLHAPYVAGSRIWFHRDLPDEVAVPFEVEIVHRDDDILVVDKPHFLATIPRGRHVLQSALVRLRRDLDLPELSPAHRLDRVTAGLVLMVIRPERRGAYQTLFMRQRIRKEYEAIAPYDPQLTFPRTVRTRIIKEVGVVAIKPSNGPPNSLTEIDLIEHRDGLGRYRLLPASGRTHQLRTHMSGLGVPILGDELYPVVTDKSLGDFSRPLQLLAKSLEFVDPVSGEERRFESRRTLRAWTSYDEWDAPR